ncbi:MAG: hypothetical protein AAF420_09865 [Pseudomonadota bacterium]
MLLSLRPFTHFTRGVLLASLFSLWIAMASRAEAAPEFIANPPPANAVAVTIELALTASEDNNKLSALYRNGAYQPLWYGSEQGRKRAVALTRFVERIVDDGLNIHEYIVPTIDAGNPLSAAAYDLAMSMTLITVIEDVTNGRTSPDELGIEWDIAREATDPVALAARVVRAHDMNSALDNLLPRHRHSTI